MNYYVIDVREPDEYATSHVKGAINLASSKLETGTAELGDLPKEAAIIVYCQSGSRADVAVNTLRQLGYTHVTNGINQEQVEARYKLG